MDTMKTAIERALGKGPNATESLTTEELIEKMANEESSSAFGLSELAGTAPVVESATDIDEAVRASFDTKGSLFVSVGNKDENLSQRNIRQLRAILDMAVARGAQVLVTCEKNAKNLVASYIEYTKRFQADALVDHVHIAVSAAEAEDFLDNLKALRIAIAKNAAATVIVTDSPVNQTKGYPTDRELINAVQNTGKGKEVLLITNGTSYLPPGDMTIKPTSPCTFDWEEPADNTSDESRKHSGRQ